jgi:hypothetical protein
VANELRQEVGGGTTDRERGFWEIVRNLRDSTSNAEETEFRRRENQPHS